MSGICDTCSLSKGCRKPIGGMESCGRYVRCKESNYEKLFGTPERAAKTVSAMCSHGIWSCDGCPLFDEGVEHCESELGDTPSLLEWLRG